jgi:hypothetical protein
MPRRTADHAVAIFNRRRDPKAAAAIQAFRAAAGPLRDHYRASVAQYVGELGLELIDSVISGLTIAEAARVVDGTITAREVRCLGHWFGISCRVVVFVVEHTVIVRAGPSGQCQAIGRFEARRTAYEKVFGRRPIMDRATHSGPASENLQRRKPRGRMRGRAATTYGDLRALPDGTGVPRSAS